MSKRALFIATAGALGLVLLTQVALRDSPRAARESNGRGSPNIEGESTHPNRVLDTDQPSVSMDGSDKGIRREGLPWVFRPMGSSTDNSDKRAALHVLWCTDPLVEYLEREAVPTADRIADIEAPQLFELNSLKEALAISPGADQALVWVEAPGYLVHSAVIAREELDEFLDFELEPVPPLHIQVSRGGGAPLAGCTAVLSSSLATPGFMQLDWAERLRLTAIEFSGETNASGVVAFSSLPSKDMTVSVHSIGPYGPEVIGLVHPGDHCDIILRESAVFGGRVVESGGKAIASATVFFYRVDEHGRTRGCGAATTGANGQYGDANVAIASGRLVAVAMKEGYTTREVFLEPVSSGGTRRQDFVLSRAVSIIARVAFDGGAAASGLDIQFYTDQYSWIPGEYTVDDAGKVKTRAFFHPGSEYLARLASDGNVVASLPMRIPDEEPFEVVLTVPALGRVRLAEPAARDTEGDLVFWSDSVAKHSYWEWMPEELSPWLPPGRGLLQGRMRTGALFQIRVQVSRNGTTEVIPDRNDATLSFRLPDEPAGGTWAVQIENVWGDPVIVERDVAAGAQITKSVPIGVYYLYYLDDSNRGSLGPIAVPGSGVDLGVLPSTGFGRIVVRAVGEDLAPVAGIEMALVASSGSPRAEQRTDGDGLAVFEGIAPGTYYMVAHPYDSQMLRSPVLQRSLHIHAGSETSVRFVIPDGGRVVVRVDPLGDGGWSGFLVAGALLESEDVGPDGMFAVDPVVTGVTVVGAVQSRLGGLALVARVLSGALPSQISVDGSRGAHKDLEFVTTDGTPLTGSPVFLEIEHVRLPWAATLTSGGRLHLDYTRDVSASLIVRPESGPEETYDLGALPSTGKVLVGTEELNAAFLVQDYAEKALSGVTIYASNGSSVAVSNADGGASLRLPRLGVPVWVERGGYWPVKVAAGHQVRVTLRRMGCRMEVEVPAGLPVTRLGVQPRFISGYEWKPVLQRDPKDERRWSAADLPEGDYTVYGFDKLTRVVVRGEATLVPGRTVRVQLGAED